MSYGLKYYYRGEECGEPDYGLCGRPGNELSYDVLGVEEIFVQLHDDIARLTDMLRRYDPDCAESVTAGCA